MDTAPLQPETTAAPKPALPLLALLALASVLGVAVAVVLAGLAMLLAAPAYGAEIEGHLLLEREGRLAEAPLLHIETETTHAGPVVYTRIVAVFQNPFGERLAALYVHRLPPDATLERLALGEEEEAVEARPAVLRLGSQPHVVERAAEIGPGETLVIELEYRRRRRLLAMR